MGAILHRGSSSGHLPPLEFPFINVKTQQNIFWVVFDLNCIYNQSEEKVGDKIYFSGEVHAQNMEQRKEDNSLHFISGVKFYWSWRSSWRLPKQS